MSIFETANKLEKLNNTDAILVEVKRTATVQVTKNELSKAIKDIEKHLSDNQHHKAIAILSLLIMWNPNKTISRLRRAGVLRVSRYDFRSSGVKKVVDTALKLLAQPCVDGVEVENEKLNYLESIKNLISISSDVKKVREQLIHRINSRKTTVLKTLLAFINKCFSDGWVPNHQSSPNTIEHWSVEELTEAYSYILKLSREKLNISNNWIYVDTNFGTSFNAIYSELLVNAKKVNLYLEAEILLDGLPYKAELNNRHVHLSAIDPLFEKSVRLGYIQADMQRAIRIARFSEEFDIGNTIEKFTAEAFKAGMEELVPIIKEPIERIVFTIPAIEPFFQPINQDAFFADEQVGLVGMQIDSFMEADENPLSIPVSNELTVQDVIKIQRLFGFINATFREKVKSFSDKEYGQKMYVRSVIPVLKHADLLMMLKEIYTIEKAEKLIELLTLKEDESHIDLQYKPLIKDREFYIVSPALLQRSNLTRNIVVANDLRSVQVDEQNDPLQKSIAKELCKAGFKVEENVNFKIDGKDCETDIVCWKDGHLFVFECKNPYHPCNSHELRNSFGHIEKGREQLDLRLTWLKNLENQEKLFGKLGWDTVPTESIHTSIISGNRLLHGLCTGSHPVRQGHEFINVLSKGTITYPISDEVAHSFWEGDIFNVNDLIGYLKGESIIGMQLESLIQYSDTIDFKECSMTFHRYQLDTSNFHHEATSSNSDIE